MSFDRLSTEEKVVVIRPAGSSHAGIEMLAKKPENRLSGLPPESFGLLALPSS